MTHWSVGDDGRWRCAAADIAKAEEGEAAIYQATVTGLRDYVGKNRFPGVVIGLSGGIDSALSAAIAVDALGPDAVHCVMMPSRYTSQGSLDDARACAERLGVRLDTVPIESAVEAYGGMLGELFASREPDVTEENLQARIRGMILMAISNKLGHMVLTTGNKSEMSVGYATLYGDMCGGYSVLKGRLQDDGLRAGALAQRNPAGRRQGSGRRGHTRRHHHQAAVGRTQARSDPTRTACHPTRCSTTSSNACRGRAGHRRDRRARSRRRRRAPRLVHARSRRIQAPPGAARRQDHQPRLRPRPRYRYPITNRFRYGA